MKKMCIAAAFVIFIQLFVSGCASVGPKITEDTIKEIYAGQKDRPKEYPVIFVPGIFGTVLKDTNTGKILWGNISEGMVRELALPIESAVMSANVDAVVPARSLMEFAWIPGVAEVGIYERMRRIAVDAAGYKPGEDAFSLPYDWRRDLVEGAQRLGELIDKIKEKRPARDLKFDIVCHSAGGLVARYYAKYGTEDVLGRDPIPEPTYAGAKNINKIIMLGTPNLGSLEAFEHIHYGITIPGVFIVGKDITFTMPSAYELMPFYNVGAFIDAKGNDLAIDLYDPANWEKYGWSVFNPFYKATGAEKAKQRAFLAAVLKRARAFQEALWKGSPEEEARRVTYVLLGSDAEPTYNKAFLQQTQGGWDTRFDPHDDTLAEKAFSPGDTSVTRKSLLGTLPVKGADEEKFPSSYEIFMAQHHTDLPNDPTFMDNVLHSLLDKGNK